jgi:hypothetical protein
MGGLTMRIHFPLALWLVIAFARQQPPPAPPSSAIPSTGLQTPWAAQVAPDDVLDVGIVDLVEPGLSR